MKRATGLWHIAIVAQSLVYDTGAASSFDGALPDVTVRISQPAKPLSPDLFGVFFEDINYSADGGLYAELVQNRSFEYTCDDNKAWNALTSWEFVQRGSGKGSVEVQCAAPLNSNNRHYAVLKVERAGDGVGVLNSGFDGIALKAGENYDFSIFARTLSDGSVPMAVRFERKNGEVLGEAAFSVADDAWAKRSTSIHASGDESEARLVLLAKGAGSIAVDMVSLFPQKTFRNRPNGLRTDLAKVIADLEPHFVRFPGGCLAHGDGLDNIYRWKDTVGPVETRRAQRNIWRYHQTVGLGYFEYFQFCEDIGAKPLPVVAAGVCCQNAGRYVQGASQGQQQIPMEQMPAYVQDVLDLVEYANGPATSAWGAKRASAGHPSPFNLCYLGVGNEDQISPGFKERFKMIEAAVRRKHPEIKLVGTAGPFPDGRDFEEGWTLARELRVAVVDEHYYRSPEWFLNNLNRYDAYDRSGPAVYVGEYAAHDIGRRSTLRSALAEAAYMTTLERNGDIVRLASYAPLLAKQGHTQWRPDLVYFDNQTVTPTINYYVQQMFSLNAGDRSLAAAVQMKATNAVLAASAVLDTGTGDLILKLVNPSDSSLMARLDIAAFGEVCTNAACTALCGAPMAENRFAHAPAVLPTSSTITVGPVFNYTASAYSFTVIRVRRGQR